MFLPEHWGKGYATEALKAWVTWYSKFHPEGSEKMAYLKRVRAPEAVVRRNVMRKCRRLMWWYGIQYDTEGYEKEEKQEGNEHKKRVMLDVWKVERPHSRRDHLLPAIHYGLSNSEHAVTIHWISFMPCSRTNQRTLARKCSSSTRPPRSQFFLNHQLGNICQSESQAYFSSITLLTVIWCSQCRGFECNYHYNYSSTS